MNPQANQRQSRSGASVGFMHFCCDWWDDSEFINYSVR